MKRLDKSICIVQGTYNEQTQSCLICLEPITHPVQCQKCTTIFCKKCALRWKKNNRRCPKKCSQNQWIFSQLKSLNILLRCPYQNQQCKNMSPQEFEHHYKICDKFLKSKTTKTKEQLKKQYLCKYGHKLSYMGQNYRKSTYSTCAQCQQQRQLCRSICIQCKQNQEQNVTYCCLCRNPPMKRSICPQQHKFKLRYHRLRYVTCDYCGKKVELAGEYCYNETICDYALCLTCFNELPKQQNIIYQIEEGDEPLLQFLRFD